MVPCRDVQRSPRGELAREQYLQQVSSVAVCFRDCKLPELDEGLPGERAGDVDEADQRGRERQRGFTACV